MARTLDHKRPYGTIHGDSQGRRFEQDGRHFDVHGQEWRDPQDDPAPAEGGTPEQEPDTGTDGASDVVSEAAGVARKAQARGK